MQAYSDAQTGRNRPISGPQQTRSRQQVFPREVAKPSILRRVVAIAVLVLAAVVAIRLIFEFVAGIISAVLWILVVVALVVAAL